MEKISDITRNKIKDKSAAALPDNPSEAGYTAEEIKNAFIAPITDVKDSVVAEINRVVGEIGETIAALDKNAVKLGDVDNTSDADKPISTATQTALEGKSTVAVGGVLQNAIAFTSDPQEQIDDMWKRIYPVGYIYQSTNPTSPASLFGGTWQRFGNGRVLVGVNENDASFNTVQKEGGEKTHTLTPFEAPKMPTFGSTAPTGGEIQELYPVLKRVYGSEVTTSFSGAINPFGGGAHNNLQPYITVYMWVRTA